MTHVAPKMVNVLDFAHRKRMGKSLLGFSQLYLTTRLAAKADYVAPAKFHREMIEALGDLTIEMLEILGFRSSAKSFYGSLALPLWAALEHPDRYQFIVIVGDTQRQASAFIAGIKDELENNDLLINDYGAESDGGLTLKGAVWQQTSLTLANGVKIMARSRGQKVRGLKHGYYRPKLVIVDDPEDIDHVKTQDNRDKSEKWFVGEVLPAMDARTARVVLIGNLLHDDSLLSRMKPRMGKVLEYSLAGDYPGTDYEGLAKHCQWPALYPTAESIRKQAEKVGAEAFSREWLLRIVPPGSQVIKPDDIHYYDKLPESWREEGGVEHIVDSAGFVGHGMDCAISTKQTADFTAIVDGEAFYVDGVPRIYVHPNPWAQRARFHDVIEHAKRWRAGTGKADIWYVETNNVGEAAIQEMERALIPVVPFTATKDKRTRLEVIAPYVRNGTVLFPRTGCEELLQQIFSLGSEKHDDLNDAFVWLIWGMAINQGIGLPVVGAVEM